MAKHISPAISEFAMQECERLRVENERLRTEVCAIAALADGQGRLNLMQVAASARALLARLDREWHP